MTAAPLDLSVVMPCLNEAETLGICIEKARQKMAELGIHGEVLIGDNGSTDGSIAIAEQAGARIVHVAEKGYGNALYGAIQAAKGKYILMGDADDSYDFGELDKFYHTLEKGYHLVMGCRLPWGGGTIKKGAMPWLHRYLGNPVITLIGKIFFNSGVNDFYCGMRAFTREAIDRMNLQADGMVFATEMVIKAELYNMKIAEVPITLHPDGRTGKPHLRTWQDGWRTLKFLLMMSPRWLFRIPGIVLIILGAILSAITAFRQFQIGGIVLDVHTYLVAAVMIIIGYQALLFSLFAQKFATTIGIYPRHQQPKSWNIDHFILLSILAMIIGMVLIAYQFFDWAGGQFGLLDYAESMRRIIPGALFTILGFQTFLGSFFMGVLDLKKKP